MNRQERDRYRMEEALGRGVSNDLLTILYLCDRYEAALTDISEQMTTVEVAASDDPPEGDIDDGYDTIIERARTALNYNSLEEPK